MRWVAYVEARGLYAAAHQPPGGSGRPRALVDNGIVLDGCPLAYRQGLQVGMPAWQVRRQVPGIEVLTAGAADYRPLQQAFWSACAAATPWVEPVAGHQVFLSLPGPAAPPQAELALLLERAQSAIAQVAGTEAAQVSLRSGLAANKLVARAAARAAAVRDDRRVAVVRPGQEAAFLAPLPAAALWRAGSALQERFLRLGLSSIGDIAGLPAAQLWQQFGAAGMELERWARGEDPDPVRALYPPRTVAVQVPLAEGATLSALPVTIARAARELAAGLGREQAGCQHLELCLRLAGVPDITLQHRLPRPRHDAWALEQGLLSLWRGFRANRTRRRWDPIALVVRAGELSPIQWHQLDLWGQTTAGERTRKLEQALTALQARFPAGTVRVGARVAANRREAMLTLYDPYRWSPGGTVLS